MTTSREREQLGLQTSPDVPSPVPVPPAPQQHPSGLCPAVPPTPLLTPSRESPQILHSPKGQALPGCCEGHGHAEPVPAPSTARPAPAPVPLPPVLPGAAPGHIRRAG